MWQIFIFVAVKDASCTIRFFAILNFPLEHEITLALILKFLVIQMKTKQSSFSKQAYETQDLVFKASVGICSMTKRLLKFIVIN